MTLINRRSTYRNDGSRVCQLKKDAGATDDGIEGQVTAERDETWQVMLMNWICICSSHSLTYPQRFPRRRPRASYSMGFCTEDEFLQAIQSTERLYPQPFSIQVENKKT